jgi:hypothetical protein
VVDDHALSSLHHSPRHCTSHVEGALQVDIDDIIPILIFEARQDVVARDAGVVHQDGHRPQIALDGADQVPNPLCVGYVARVAPMPIAREAPRHLGRALAVSSDDGHPGSRLCKDPTHGQPDPA